MPDTVNVLRREDEVVVGVHLTVGAGGAELHPCAAERVEEKRGAPAVAQLTARVDRGVIAADELEVQGVLASEGGGDIRVVADRIALSVEIGLPGEQDSAEDLQVPLDRGARGIEFVGQR